MIKTAKVISIDDADQKGKIQVRIYPELAELKSSNLPWAKPKLTNYESKHCIPEINSFIYVEVNDDWTSFYYIDSVKYMIENYKYDEVKDIIGNVDEISGFSYPNPDFKLNPNGFIEFYNKENTETGYIHPSGTYIVFKENGDYYIKNPNMFELHFSENKIQFKNIETLEVGGDDYSGVLYEPLKDILDKLKTHTHDWSLTLSGDVPPIVPALVAGGYSVSGTINGTTSQSSDLSLVDTTSIKSDILKIKE